MFTAIVYVLTSGCAWRHLPPSFGVSAPIAHSRFTPWVKDGVFDELHRRSSIGSVPAGTWTGPPRPTHRPPRRCRLTIRYEHHGENFAAFLRLAAASTCFEKLAE